jgi:hypothetical protein
MEIVQHNTENMNRTLQYSDDNMLKWLVFTFLTRLVTGSNLIILLGVPKSLQANIGIVAQIMSLPSASLPNS